MIKKITPISNNIIIPYECGIITFLVLHLFRFLQKLPPQIFIGNRVDLFNKSNFSNLSNEAKREIAIKRVRKIDIYILVCLFIEILCIFIANIPLGQNAFLKIAIVFLSILRIIDIIQVNINSSLFDIIMIKNKSNFMASVIRTIVNVFINYFEMIACFGIIYNYNLDNFKGMTHWSDSYYYSITTQTTFGFGSIIPIGYLKWITSLQLLLGYFFTALIISRLISLLPQGKSIAGDSQFDD